MDALAPPQGGPCSLGTVCQRARAGVWVDAVCQGAGVLELRTPSHTPQGVWVEAVCLGEGGVEFWMHLRPPPGPGRALELGRCLPEGDGRGVGERCLPGGRGVMEW